MAAPVKRPFTLLDGMVLIAATAVGLGIMKAGDLPQRGLFAHHPHLVVVVPGSMFFGITYGMYFAVTLAAAILRLREPRPPWREVCRQPGFVASLASVFAVTMFFLVASFVFGRRIEEWHAWFSYFGVFSPVVIAPAVAGTWIILALTGRWCAEASWIDRLGWLSGLVWIEWFVLLTAVQGFGVRF
jgi:uncharacterized membrane protein YbaN (DUF454 family)